MTTNNNTERVYRSAIQVQLGGTRVKREASDAANLGLKEVEFKLDIGRRRLPSPDVKKPEQERAPEFVIRPRRQFVDGGQSAKFKVSFEGSPSTQLSWSKGGQSLSSSSKFKMYEQDGYHYLEIQNVESDDSGVYICSIQNAAGKDTASAELDVFAKPKLLTRNTPAPPVLVTPLKDVEVAAGEQNVRLECRVQDADDSQVTWFHNGKEVQSGNRYQICFTGTVASLVLQEAEEDDSGLYECVLSSSGGEIRTSGTLSVVAGEKSEPRAFIRELRDTEVQNGNKVELVTEVKEVEKPQPPDFLTRPVHMTVEEGTNATFTCCVSGRPLPTIWWEHNGCKLSQSKKFQILSSGQLHTLEIVGTEKADSGPYMCYAENSSGLVIHTCSLIISLQKSAPLHDADFKTSKISREPVGQTGEQNSQELEKSKKDNFHDFRNVLKKSRVPVTQPETDSLEQKMPPSAAHTHAQSAVPSISPGTTRKNLDLFESMSIYEQNKPSVRQQLLASKGRNQRGQITVAESSATRSSVLQTQVAQHPVKNWAEGGTRQEKLTSSEAPKDFGGVLKRQRTTHRNTGLFTNSTLKYRTSWSKRIENRRSAVEPNSVGVSRKDFRSVLKKCEGRNSVIGTELKPKAHKDFISKSNVQEDFRSILEKRKSRIEEKKHIFTHISVDSKLSSEKSSNIVLNTDVSSLKSKFESRPRDFNGVPLKPSRQPPPELIIQSRLENEGLMKFVDGKRSNADTARTEPSSFKPLSEGLSAMSRVQRETPRTSDYSSASDMSQDTDISQTPDILQSVDITLKRHWLVEEEDCHGNSATRCQAPSIVQPLENQRARYGGQAIFKCKILGKPEPDIKWSVNQKTIKPSKFFKLSFEENYAELVISEAFSEDEGEYICTATNQSGTVSSSCYLSVEASSSKSESRAFEGPVSTPPCIVSLFPQSIAVQRGQPVRLTLTFTGEPAPSIRWFQSKRELIAGDHIRITHEAGTCSLVIDSVKPGDTGRYAAIITNDLGSDRASANITVQDVPDPPVGKPHVYDVSKDSMSLSWCGPAFDGGSQVTHYAIEVQEANEQTWTTLTSDCQSTSYYVANLQPDRLYSFRVRAGNKLGLSEPSEVSDVAVLIEPLLSPVDYESDEPPEVFSPTVEHRGRDCLPFEHKKVKICLSRKFEDHYELLDEVGRGKFGNVYKCLEKGTSAVWAAKVIKCREKEKENVRREVDIMNCLAHPKLLMLWDAFEAPQTMVLVMEYVGAGELFERVIRKDFVLTERDCVHFMQQICSGVGYMHSQSILHLDLKPENILCVAENSNEIKIIDFGLARTYMPGESIKILHGTPEFIAPEVINYDEVDFSTDLWSIGVICYILLSGLSPFLGDNDAETLANVTSGEYDFDEEPFEDISENAKDFIQRLLVKRRERRSTIEQCLQHPWLAMGDQRARCKRLNTERLRDFMARRKWQVVDEEETHAEGASGNRNVDADDDDETFLGSVANHSKHPTKAATRHSGNQERPSVPETSAHPDELLISSFRRRQPADAESDCKPRRAAESRLTTKTDLLVEESNGDLPIPTQADSPAASRLPGTQSKDLTKNAVIPGVSSIRATAGDSKLAPSHTRDPLVARGDRAKRESPRAGVAVATDETPSRRFTRKPARAPDDPKLASSRRDVVVADTVLEPSFSRKSAAAGVETTVAPSHAETAFTASNGTTTAAAPPPSCTREPTVASGNSTPASSTSKTTVAACGTKDVSPCRVTGVPANDSATCVPFFTKEMVDCTAVVGDVVRFDVRVAGVPEPELVWLFEDEAVAPDERRRVELGTGGQCSLIMRNVTEEDEGEYSCRARSCLGQVTCSAELTVYKAPCF